MKLNSENHTNFFRLSPEPKEASGSTTYSIRSDPNFVDDEDGWMREFLPKENEDDIDEIELEEIQDRWIRVNRPFPVLTRTV